MYKSLFLFSLLSALPCAAHPGEPNQEQSFSVLQSDHDGESKGPKQIVMQTDEEIVLKMNQKWGEFCCREINGLFCGGERCCSVACWREQRLCIKYILFGNLPVVNDVHKKKD